MRRWRLQSFHYTITQELRGPKIGKDKSIDWDRSGQADHSKTERRSSNEGGQIRIVSNTILSPSTKAAIEKFKGKFPTTQHVQYDQSFSYGMLKANEESFGAAMIPSYDFSKATVIVSIGADFLGSWISPIEYTKQYG